MTGYKLCIILLLFVSLFSFFLKKLLLKKHKQIKKSVTHIYNKSARVKKKLLKKVTRHKILRKSVTVYNTDILLEMLTEKWWT